MSPRKYVTEMLVLPDTASLWKYNFILSTEISQKAISKILFASQMRRTILLLRI